MTRPRIQPGRTKKDRIVAELRAMIASGEVARGDRILQNELATRFETSITPVREALRQLEAEGLLVSSPHRGVRVTSADIDEVKGVYIARRLIEPHAMKRAVSRVSRRDLRQAADLNEEMRVASEAGDEVKVGDANREFHFLFYDRCGSPGLRDVIETLWLGFPWDILHVLAHRRPESIQEHELMLERIAAYDIAGVGRAAEEHLRRSYLALAEHLGVLDAPDPFDLDVD